jgi:gluconolactonase
MSKFRKKIGNFSTAGSTVAFEIVIDDYAEVWVNGKMPRVLGQPGGPVVKGFNARIGSSSLETRNPANAFSLRSSASTARFPTARRTLSGSSLRRLTSTSHPKLQSVTPRHRSQGKIRHWTKLFQPARRSKNWLEDFLFTEGPIWVPRNEESEGYLLFSDPNNNVIYRWTQDGQLSIFMTKSGYRGMDIGEYGQPGSNGLTLDRQRPSHYQSTR